MEEMEAGKTKVAVVIPAHNEASRIGVVLDAVIACPEAEEVIVVDDGSSDGTPNVADRYNVKVLRLEPNVGKGGAMAAGIAATDADILVFIDADLLGFKPEHLSALIKPMLADPALDMTAGRFVGGRLATNLSQKIMPSINSQRAIRRELIEAVPDFATSRFGVETIINDYVKKSKANVLAVSLDGVAQVMKEEKHGLVKGAGHRARMYRDIIKHKTLKK